MLNRLFIAIGVLVILAIGAAFVVPRFVQWGDYRGRLETMAAEVFSTEVAITGDIQLTLLPQPKLEFTKVRVGPAGRPAMEVERVEAEFSLFDFLRDQYRVTRLKLDHAVVNLAVGADGTLGSVLVLKPDAAQSSVSIANADVVEGTIRLADARSGESYAVEAVNGQVRLEALRGPFSFQGTASFDGAGYGLRIGTGAFDQSGATTLSAYLKADDDSFAVETGGVLQVGASPKYAGDLTYRRPPPKPKEGETADAGRGDFVLEGKLEAAADRVLLSNYTVIPDENRSATRLTGAAELKLGKGMAFNAVVSGGVIALPPRDATKELAEPPYELVRLLSETPLPPIPEIPGTIGLDIAELNLRAVSLRDLRLDAATDGKSWTIKDFAATLPGGTSVGFSGNLSVVDGHPIFAGGIALTTEHLDRLAQLWRKPPEGNPLFNVPGSLTADVALSSDALTLSSGTLVVAGINQGFDAEIGFGATRRLKLDAHFTTLGEAESAAIGALLPDVNAGGSFGATFPTGEISLSASKAVLFGLQGTELALVAGWEGGVVQFSKLSAVDLGGAAFDAKLTAFGTLAKPELSGSGTVRIADGAPAIDAMLTGLDTPLAVRVFLGRSLPADLVLQLDAPAGDGGQTLSATGKLGTAEAMLDAKLAAGLVNALTAPIAARLDLRSDSPGLMTAQLGLGDAALFDGRAPLHLTASIEGVPSNSYETHFSLEGGDDHIAFSGNVVPGDFTRITGDGDVDAKLGDPGGLVEAMGAGGVYVPPISGKGRLQFVGLDSVKLSEIEVAGASGDLEWSRLGDLASVTGSIVLPSLEVSALLPVLAGASATITGGDGAWPDGPIDIGAAPRRSEGRIDIAVATLTAGGGPLVSDGRFGLDWDAQSVHLRNLSGSVGGGTIGFDASVCCSNGAQTGKQISGRLTLAGVSIDALAPPAIAAALDGRLDASAAFDGNGASVAEAVAAMTGTGSYTITDFVAAHFDPGTFNEAGALSGVVDMTPEALGEAVTARLGAGPFAAPSATGTFTLAGGMLRGPNLAISGAGARIFGGAALRLEDLTLNARYAMTPTDLADPASAIDLTAAEIAAVVSGPLWSPVTSYDVSSLIDGMKIKASEIELVRLEQLRAEDEARRKAAAEEQARLAAEQAAAAAAKNAADEAAAKKAAEEAAAKKAAEEAAAQQAPPQDLGL
ncbi:MAG: AsmA family protein [Devosia nanyangense]|uniref:AsmA family protein n=1 Tax=Devosia nanyangense TaxID=1228055 RepID=A0A933L3X0_9HYPH|nr:AsmA family protein [Devosia nanyangense]